MNPLAHERDLSHINILFSAENKTLSLERDPISPLTIIAREHLGRFARFRQAVSYQLTGRYKYIKISLSDGSTPHNGSTPHIWVNVKSLAAIENISNKQMGKALKNVPRQLREDFLKAHAAIHFINPAGVESRLFLTENLLQENKQSFDLEIDENKEFFENLDQKIQNKTEKEIGQDPGVLWLKKAKENKQFMAQLKEIFYPLRSLNRKELETQDETLVKSYEVFKNLLLQSKEEEIVNGDNSLLFMIDCLKLLKKQNRRKYRKIIQTANTLYEKYGNAHSEYNEASPDDRPKMMSLEARGMLFTITIAELALKTEEQSAEVRRKREPSSDSPGLDPG